MAAQAVIQPTAAVRQFLTFELGARLYGIDILRVREIRGFTGVRELPDTPDYLKGVLNLRGELIPVVDLRVRLRTGEAVYGPTTVIIVLSAGSEGRSTGVVVDRVSDVLDAAHENCRDTPDLGIDLDRRYLAGMVLSASGDFVVLLDPDRLAPGDTVHVG